MRKTDALTDKFREFAWNGIRFMAPADWEESRIGTRHLMLEDEAGPAMEIKWGIANGANSPHDQRQRLAAMHSKAPGRALTQWPLPGSWRRALAQFEASGFAWQGDRYSGHGAMLFCPTCRRSSLVQFFQTGARKPSAAAARVLATLQDHPLDGHIQWAVFDIQAMMPEKFRLVRHRFESGKFELEFSGRGFKMTLHRWAPAAVILAERSLAQVAASVADIADTRPQPFVFRQFPAVQAAVTAGSDPFVRLRLKPAFKWLRLWHLAEKNRILGLVASGRKSPGADVLNRICENYGTF